ncbi:MAG: SEL1-like repeat protein [Treponema sp.]|jgi:cation transport ATPase|nr:SEL1-like repeat protein [Treponema sp.]
MVETKKVKITNPSEQLSTVSYWKSFGWELESAYDIIKEWTRVSPAYHHVELNFTRDTDLIKNLAEQGSAHAQYILGIMYEEGQGIPQDSVKATELIRKAAASGNKEAQEKVRKWEEERKHQEWLASPEGQQWQAEEEEKAKKAKAERKAAEKRRRIGRIIAVLIQIGAIILFFIAEYHDNAPDPMSFVIVVNVILVALFTWIFIGKGIFPLIIIILWSIFVFFLVGSTTGIEAVKTYYIAYSVGNVIAAITAFVLAD